jgi:hypothetical protein
MGCGRGEVRGTQGGSFKICGQTNNASTPDDGDKRQTAERVGAFQGVQPSLHKPCAQRRRSVMLPCVLAQTRALAEPTNFLSALLNIPNFGNFAPGTLILTYYISSTPLNALKLHLLFSNVCKIARKFDRSVIA